MIGSSSKKRKGGILQRMNAAQEDVRTQSSLYVLLMSMYARGELSGAKVHAIAQAAQDDINKAHDGFQVVDLDRIARLQQSRNLARTLTAMMAKDSSLPMPMEVHIPMKGLADGVPCNSLLLPHEMFSAFFENGSAWQKSILPDSSKLTAFWDSFAGHPCFDEHPLLTIPNYKATTIPLGLHGDECPVLGVGKIWCKCALFFLGSP